MNTIKRSLTAVALAASFLPYLGAQSLLLNWNFDESDSGTANATDHGETPLAPGIFSNTATRTGNTPAGFSLGAADVTASDSSLVITQPSTLDGKLDNLTSLTVSLWVNFQDDPAALDRIFRVGAPGAGGNGFGIRIENPPSGTLSASNFDVSLDLTSTGAGAFGASLDADDKWLFLAITWDAASSQDNVALYVGTENQAVQFAGFGNRPITDSGVVSNTLGLGGLPGTTSRAISAYLDDFRVYSGAGDLDFAESIRVSNIPEPRLAAFMLGGLGICLVLARRRRKLRDAGCI